MRMLLLLMSVVVLWVDLVGVVSCVVPGRHLGLWSKEGRLLRTV